MSKKNDLVRPSLLAGNFLNLEADIKEMIDLGIEKIHFDVMDGSFVSDISFGKPLFDALLKFASEISMDVHLMVINPIKQLKNFIRYGAKELSFHVETLTEEVLNEYLSLRRDNPDVHFSLAFSPQTPIQKHTHLLQYFDGALVMSVLPGKGGQKYIQGSEEKIAILNAYRLEKSRNFSISVDGGINLETAPLCLNNGVDHLICGSSYFKAVDKKEFLLKISTLC